MSAYCKGICTRHKFIRGNNGGYYIHGGKRCSVCCLFIEWQGVYCPCCGFQLRVGPHLAKDKRKFRKNKELVKNGKIINKIRRDLCNNVRRSESENNTIITTAAIKTK